MSNVTVVFVVEMTEHERGWGQRPDGNLAFVDEQTAKAYVDKETKDRTGPAPDEYISYNLLGYRACTSAFLKTVKGKGQVYFSRLSELQP